MSLNLRLIPLTFNQTAHSEDGFPHNADNIVVLRVEADLSHPAPGLGAGDDLPLLPEEVDQLEVRGSALGQEVHASHFEIAQLHIYV